MLLFHHAKLRRLSAAIASLFRLLKPGLAPGGSQYKLWGKGLARLEPWRRQQLVKLAAAAGAIEGLLPAVLLADGDVIWRRNIRPFGPPPAEGPAAAALMAEGLTLSGSAITGSEGSGSEGLGQALLNNGHDRFDKKAPTYKAFVEQVR